MCMTTALIVCLQCQLQMLLNACSVSHVNLISLVVIRLQQPPAGRVFLACVIQLGITDSDGADGFPPTAGLILLFCLIFSTMAAGLTIDTASRRLAVAEYFFFNGRLAVTVLVENQLVGLLLGARRGHSA
jgi:hypothetical protein